MENNKKIDSEVSQLNKTFEKGKFENLSKEITSKSDNDLMGLISYLAHQKKPWTNGRLKFYIEKVMQDKYIKESRKTNKRIACATIMIAVATIINLGITLYRFF